MPPTPHPASVTGLHPMTTPHPSSSSARAARPPACPGLIALLLMSGCTTPEVTPEPSPALTETPQPSPNQTQTPQPSPELTPTPQPSPGSSPTPDPTPTLPPLPDESPLPGTLPGTLLLGRPSDQSVTVSLLPETALEVYFELGTEAGHYTRRTEVFSLAAATPFLQVFSDLQANQSWYYRVCFRSSGQEAFLADEEHRFHTQRPDGDSFVFTVQADSHLDNNSDLSLYQITLQNALLDQPDFHLDLGDTFMCEKFSEPFTGTVDAASDYATVEARYVFERSNFGLLTHSVPLFLVNGNHEGETGWLLNDSAENLPIWATTARQTYYLNPVPDGFYSGDTVAEPVVGQRASYYAWEWGDALFITLDPYWETDQNPKKGGAWAWTLGDDQYWWLRDTLETSQARFKFIFIHHLLGGVDEQARGGAEAAPYYEWGGLNADNTWGFDTERPTWGKPIHTLLVENGANIVFHGHDHLYVQQSLDGIVYQETPQPSCPNFNNAATLATEGGYASGVVLGSSGHLRVTVSQAQAEVDYVRAYRPQDENGSRHNRDISATYAVLPR